MPKKLKWLLFVSLSLSLTNCAPKPPDVPVCEHFPARLSMSADGHMVWDPSPTCMKQTGEPECGHCVYLVSGKEIFVAEGKDHWLNGKTWSKIRSQSAYLPATESYAPLATYIINACKKMNCSDSVDQFKVKLDSLNGISGALSNP